MTGPVVEAQGVVKTLGEGAGRVQAVKGVDIALQPGELTLLMGPSGSGKTTLLSILGCVLTPTEGSVTIAGKSTQSLDKEALAEIRRSHIGFVFQSFHLFSTLTAEENVSIVLDVRGQLDGDAQKRVTEALAAVGIAHKAQSLPKKLSGGEQQRVAIARALVGRPALILADEPTSALDAENGQAVMTLLAELAHTHKSAVMAVTHDARTVPFADRIIRIEDGLIVGEERPSRAGDSAARH